MAIVTGCDPLRGSSTSKSVDTPLASVRVLEIGEFALFKRSLPVECESYYAGYRAYNGEGRRFFGLRDLLHVMARAKDRSAFDLVVLHPPLLPWWSPRSLLYALRYSLTEGRALDIYGAIASPFYFSLLRLVRFAMPVVAIDRGDGFTIPSQHMNLIDRVDAYYKRELPVDRWRTFFGVAGHHLPGENMRKHRRWRDRLAKLRPIGLGLRKTHVEEALALERAPKSRDVFFAGTLHATSFVRERLGDLVAQLRKAGVDVDLPDERLPYREYLSRCSAAWLTLSPEGFGWDCYRHVEAAIVGSVPVLNAPTIERYEPMRAGEHCLVYFPDDVPGAVDMIRSALADKPKLLTMARAAEAHALGHLTEAAICRALIQEWTDPPDAEDGGPSIASSSRRNTKSA
jgi:hypothetical protein